MDYRYYIIIWNNEDFYRNVTILEKMPVDNSTEQLHSNFLVKLFAELLGVYQLLLGIQTDTDTVLIHTNTETYERSN